MFKDWTCVLYRDQYKGEDERVYNFWVVVWQLMLDVVLGGGSLNQMWNVFCLEKSTYYIVGVPEVLELRGFWGIELIAFADPALHLCSIFETEPCLSNRVDLCGDYVVGYELYSHVKQLVDPREEIKMSD